MVNNILQKVDQFSQEKNLILNTTATESLEEKTANRLRPHQSQRIGDTVDISDEARKLSDKNTNKISTLGADKTDESNFVDFEAHIRKQIEKVKEKLQEAQTRLAQAQGSIGGSGKVSANANEDPSEAAMKEAINALAGSAEVEAIQVEIKILSQQLMTLNNQLNEVVGGGSEGANMDGTAGLGGAGELGGLGERMPVNL